jgi:pimeloyl-ACP methyl ester carboxylesterase
MSQLLPEAGAPTEGLDRPPCPAPASIRHELAHYDQQAEVGSWDGPHYRMTYRVLGQGPPLILVPGIASTYRIYSLFLNRLAERFRTVLFDYPGEHDDDRANLRAIGHDHLVDDLFGLIDHLRIGRAFLVGLSFGSTVALKALAREPRRFPRGALQGAFAHRDFTVTERWALRAGRLFPGNLARLPLRERVLTHNAKPEFPSLLEDRWGFYLEQNGLTPIKSLAHRVSLLLDLDLRPILSQVATEVLLVQGNEDRIVSRRYFDELKSALPRSEGVILPTVGHEPHLTHAEVLARMIGDWFLPCAPGGCELERGAQSPAVEAAS